MVDFKPVVPLDETFDAVLGLEWISIAADKVEATLPLRPHYFTAPGWLQTGIPAALAETIASTGTARVVIPRGEIAMGQWNQTAVVAAAVGETLSATATVISAGADQWLWNVRMVDAEGTVVASSEVSIVVRKAPES
jgi:1,4-dihydroxy-2-naphthoyl-CoA hydrolase